MVRVGFRDEGYDSGVGIGLVVGGDIKYGWKGREWEGIISWEMGGIGR